jgi:hypothetical protein
MKVGVMQPYFLPYIGYFQLMKSVDKYVIADDVNFIKGGWINRNYMLLDGKPFMFHLLLQGASPNKWIRDVMVAPDQRKLLKTIDLYYRKAPYFKDVFPMMEEIIHYEDKNLARYVGNSLIKIAKYLEFETRFEYEGEIDACDRSLKAQERLIADCKLYGATEYINAIGGTALYSKEDFKKEGIDLYFLKSHPVEYTQFNNHPFVPSLSILDVLMFNSVEQTNELLLQFDLV